ncbi:carboxylating nicotinate-nucleotide diphosphorylase [Actinomadura sp. HBU206391]|uniref:carboxylating nicotinate-nucleotide diphosphorylase n=1 Tax=Actinomadura sp. HBU206391 TaxID=2731692 RepID=UPI001C9BE738|nr:carboxylating nicotinate-nucleotide diphosphorylase [Actinomadura sp. HBU206391]MBC6458843.1 carboxylating nicotinate-nucleotide diphosphorylase [Actinomadura sp. HBU206391]
MTPELAGRLRDAGLDPQAVRDLISIALAEDGAVDVTSEPIFTSEEISTGDFTAREHGVVAGLPVAEAVFAVLAERAGTGEVGSGHGEVGSGSGEVGSGSGAGEAGSGRGAAPFRIEARVADGDRVAPGDVLLTVTGPTRALLRAERTVLNLLTHLSGIASATRRWVDAVEGTKARIRDTRKTLPGLRSLQKYAVRCGGGVNHRMGLQDAALVKDNHVAAAGSVTKAYEAIRARFPDLLVQVECDTLEQVEEALGAGATAILLDNMTDEQMTEAVGMAGNRAELEASGGLTVDRARDVAVTGVDYLAVGALTHSASALDIGLDFVPRSGS